MHFVSIRVGGDWWSLAYDPRDLVLDIRQKGVCSIGVYGIDG